MDWTSNIWSALDYLPGDSFYVFGGYHVKSSNDVEEVIYNCHPKVTDVLGGSPVLRLDLVGLHVVVVRG